MDQVGGHKKSLWRAMLSNTPFGEDEPTVQPVNINNSTEKKKKKQGHLHQIFSGGF